MQTEMGPIKFSNGFGPDSDVIYSLDIRQTAPIHTTNPYSIPQFALDRECAAG